MSDFGKTIIKILSLFFGALLLTFTGTETYAFLLDVTGVALIAAVGLIMFEGGFLYWALEFKKNAEGLLQMAISLLASLLDFAAVLAAVSLRLGAFDQNVLGPTTGPKIVVVAVLVNLAAKYTYDLAHPDNTKNIYKRASEGLILLRTFKAFGEKTEEIAQELADEMGETWRDEMRDDLRFRHKALTHRHTPALPAGRPNPRPTNKPSRSWINIFRQNQQQKQPVTSVNGQTGGSNNGTGNPT